MIEWKNSFKTSFYFYLIEQKRKFLLLILCCCCFRFKGSNDSNYSAPSSAGDISYEEAEKNKKLNSINNSNQPIGIGAPSVNNSANINRQQTNNTTSSSSNTKNSGQTKQQQQQRMQDAKHELELCRVRKIFLKVLKHISANIWT